MIGIDLFAGAGAMSLGAKMAGIDVRAAVEIHPAACRTYSFNHPEVLLYEDNIANIETIDLGPRDSEVILFGGPPCQGFSTSNQRTRNSGNPNNWLFKEFLRIVKMIQPEWILFENVAGILQTEKGLFIHKIKKSLDDLGYTLSCTLLNAVEFGCPQRRERYFVLGARKLSPPMLPNPNGSDKVIAVQDALGDLPSLKNGASIDVLPYRSDPQSKYVEHLRGDLDKCSGHIVSQNAPHIVARYKHIPQGGNWRDIPADMMASYKNRMRCHTGIYRRLAEDQPSVVIGNFRKNMLIHPTESRGLSVREAARLQSFPDRYTFCGSIGQQQQQVGNAVPPILAQAVFDQIGAI